MPRMNRSVKLNKNTSKTLKRLLSYIFENYRFSVILVVIFIIISSLATVVSSLFIKSLIDDYIMPLMTDQNPSFDILFHTLCLMAVVYLIGTIATYLYSKILIEVSQGTLKKIRDDLFAHMEKLPIKYFDSHSHGDIMSVYTNDTDTLRQMISQSVPQLFSSVITIVSVFISMMVLSIPLSMVVVVMVVVMQYITRKVAEKSAKYFTKQQKNLGKVNGFIEEMMNGQKVIKVFTHEEKSKEDFDQLNEELFESAYQANKYANILMPILGNLGNISYVLTAFVGGVIAINGLGGLTLGGLASFLQLNRSFNQPIGQISQQLNFVIMAIAGSQRIFAVIDEPLEIDDGIVTLCNVKKDQEGRLVESEQVTNHWAWKHPHGQDDYELVPLVGDVVFHDVDFSYNENKQILFDVNVHAMQGEKVAFVGATGAGKTTITNLINRFYDIQKGSITYDGIDIQLIKKDDLRKSLGIVLQDTHLFTGTIKENIAYATPQATDEDIIAAAKLANAHGFIKHLEHGYDTMLTSDGASLSQGQRQLLSIARAALANSPVLILDEATSSIDSRTEKIIQGGLDKLMAGRTVFVIAHRLSTIKNSDVIMVMDQGRIIERGDHDALIAKKGTYYQLYTGGLELD